MTATLEDNYKIVKHDNILVVDIQNIFAVDIVKQYHQDMVDLTLDMKHQPWGSLIIYHGSGVFSPDAEEQIVDITKFRVKHNMVANATVFLDNAHADLQQMQLRRIYGSCRLPFYVFSEMASAKTWLSDFLAKQPKVG